MDISGLLSKVKLNIFSTYTIGFAQMEHPKESTWAHMPKFRSLTFFLFLIPSITSATMSLLSP